VPDQVETRNVQARDGRNLCVEIAGSNRTRSVLVHNGTPNCRHLFGAWIRDAADRDLQLISYDRPGYGGSTAHPGHTIADGAGDVRAIAEALGVDRLAVWGLSGGGPYTLACAALLPDLVAAAATVGSPAPYSAAGLDFFAGMGDENVDDIKLYFSDPEAARKKGVQDREQFVQITTDQLVAAFGTLLSPTDAAVLTGDFADWIVRCFHDGLAPGDQGWWDDGVAWLSDWGFDLSSIRVPVKLCHGRHDRFAPFQHGQWLATQIPGVEPVLSEDDGHLTFLFDKIGTVHQWLIDRL
jgi:pimeloyl-ACP methyl ester carboxylesterase